MSVIVLNLRLGAAAGSRASARRRCPSSDQRSRAGGIVARCEEGHDGVPEAGLVQRAAVVPGTSCRLLPGMARASTSGPVASGSSRPASTRVGTVRSSRGIRSRCRASVCAASTAAVARTRIRRVKEAAVSWALRPEPYGARMLSDGSGGV